MQNIQLEIETAARNTRDNYTRPQTYVEKYFYC